MTAYATALYFKIYRRTGNRYKAGRAYMNSLKEWSEL